MNPANNAVATVFENLVRQTGAADWSEEQIAVVNDVLDAAQAVADGDLPLAAFARIGTLKPPAWSHKDVDSGVVTTCRGGDGPGYSRFKALVYALKTKDPRLPALQAAFAALSTTWGFVSEERAP